METSAGARNSIFGLIGILSKDTKRLIRQEIELAKTELSENFTLYARQTITLATGGFIAYAGLIIFLMSLGWLVAWALQKAGVDPVLAGFLGLAIIGVVVAAAGAVFLIKALRFFSKNSLAPRKTIQTLQRFNGTETSAAAVEEHKAVAKASSGEVQAQVEETEDRVSETLDELGDRLSPQRINMRMQQRIRESPYRSGLIAVAAGLASGIFLGRSPRRS